MRLQQPLLVCGLGNTTELPNAASSHGLLAVSPVSVQHVSLHHPVEHVCLPQHLLESQHKS